MKLQSFASRRHEAGFSLSELVVAVGISALVFGGGIIAYVQSTQQAEWSAYSLAAQSLASMRIEQSRAAKWDNQAAPPVDQLVATNFPTRVEVLDVPISGTNVVRATNFTTITTVATNPPLKMIRVDCVWRFTSHGLFTNTIVTYRAPDQ